MIPNCRTLLFVALSSCIWTNNAWKSFTTVHGRQSGGRRTRQSACSAVTVSPYSFHLLPDLLRLHSPSTTACWTGCCCCMCVSPSSVPMSFPESPSPRQICLHWLRGASWCVPVCLCASAVAFADVEEELLAWVDDPATGEREEKSDGNAEDRAAPAGAGCLN